MVRQSGWWNHELSWRRANRRMRFDSVWCNVECGRLGCRWADGGGDCDEEKVMVPIVEVTAKDVVMEVAEPDALQESSYRELQRVLVRCRCPSESIHRQRGGGRWTPPAGVYLPYLIGLSSQCLSLSLSANQLPQELDCRRYVQVPGPTPPSTTHPRQTAALSSISPAIISTPSPDAM
jgi:hypothetical protein